MNNSGMMIINFCLHIICDCYTLDREGCVYVGD